MSGKKDLSREESESPKQKTHATPLFDLSNPNISSAIFPTGNTLLTVLIFLSPASTRWALR